MKNSRLEKRLLQLEEARREWERLHIPLRDLSAFLLGVLTIVSEHAGPEMAGRIATRIVRDKLAEVERLRAGRG